ncbi:MAG TPA: TetR/AcrR family transcriptional regulator [Allosphingosinicella sp.]|nr:TetR/AcrR family transcriptional regulator [Allosphingosinicella sp.]
MSPESAFDTRHRARDQKRYAVLTTAAELFLSKGYHLTRLDDVADRLRITKPALYNYFRSKHDILLGCHMLGHDLIDASLAEIEETGGDGLARLRALIRAYAGVMTEPFGMCLVRLDEHELNPKALAQVRKRRQSVNERFEAYLNQGIADGSLQPCDVRLTAFWLAGALNWISRWYKPGHGMTSAQIGDYFAENLTRGLVSLKAG